MKNYELVCILDPQVGEGQFDPLVEKYETFLKAQGAEVAHIDRWGMRRLAYSSPALKKRTQGYYVLYQFSAEPTLIASLEQDLRMDDGVLRHLVTAVVGDFIRVPELAPENTLEEEHRRPPRFRGGREGGREGGRDERRGGRDERRNGRDEHSEERRPRPARDDDEGDDEGDGDNGDET